MNRRLWVCVMWLLVGAPLRAQTAAPQAPIRGGVAVIVVQADPGLNPAISTGSHVHAVAD